MMEMIRMTVLGVPGFRRDLFETRICDVALSETFPDFLDGADAAKAVNFIRDRFRERFEAHKPSTGAVFHCHVLSSRVRMEVREAMKSVRSVIAPMSRAKSRAGLLSIRSTRSTASASSRQGPPLQQGCSACCHSEAAASASGRTRQVHPAAFDTGLPDLPAAATAAVVANAGQAPCHHDPTGSADGIAAAHDNDGDAIATVDVKAESAPGELPPPGATGACNRGSPLAGEIESVARSLGEPPNVELAGSGQDV